jgi:hypothetical protein
LTIADGDQSSANFEDLHTVANAVSLLQVIGGRLQDMVSTIIRHSGETRLAQFVEVGSMLSTFVVADTRSQREADRILLRKNHGRPKRIPSLS